MSTPCPRYIIEERRAQRGVIRRSVIMTRRTTAEFSSTSSAFGETARHSLCCHNPSLNCRKGPHDFMGCRDSHCHLGTPRARQFESGALLRSMKFEKAVYNDSPREKFLAPVLSSHEYGWESHRQLPPLSGSQTVRHPRRHDPTLWPSC